MFFWRVLFSSPLLPLPHLAPQYLLNRLMFSVNLREGEREGSVWGHQHAERAPLGKHRYYMGSKGDIQVPGTLRPGDASCTVTQSSMLSAHAAGS